MSEQAQRRIPLSEIAELVQRGGDFNVDDRYAPTRDAAFTPWSKSSFKPVETRREPEPAPADEAQHAPADAISVVETPAPPHKPEPQSAQPAAPAVAAPPPAPPPPEPKEPAPSPQDIIAAIEKAREDGRALGYQQGRDAARKELGDALDLLRRMEQDLNALALDAYERNGEIMAHHVRRLAQDLFGSVFAEMPEAFVERIKTAAEMFTKAGSEFTLSLNPRDILALSSALEGEEIFRTIRIVEDDELPSGSFRLASRDLSFDDAPVIADDEA